MKEFNSFNFKIASVPFDFKKVPNIFGFKKFV